jgi:hypothetical protein
MAQIKHALPVTRAQDFAAWYQSVVSEADMAEESGVRGCMVDRKSTRLNSSHNPASRMPSSA